MLTGADVFLVPFSVLWIAVGLHLVFEAPAGPRAIGLVFVTVAGLFLLVGRFFIKAYRKRRTRYYLTNMRALIAGPQELAFFELDEKSPRVEVIGRGSHRTLKFTSDDPRSYGKLGSGLMANTGHDFLLRPGRDTRFAFYDVARTDELSAAIDALITTGKVREGIA